MSSAVVRDAVLQRLSEGARAYSAWWNVNAHNQLSFAAGGDLILTIDAFFPGRPEDYPALGQWPELVRPCPWEW